MLNSRMDPCSSSDWYSHHKLLSYGLEIFIYSLKGYRNGLNTPIIIDITEGGWITLPAQKAVAECMEKRQLQGTLTGLNEPFLTGLLRKDEHIANAILTFTRSTEMPVVDDGRSHKACGNCRQPGNPFNKCIVLKNDPNLGNSCASCLLRKCQDTCEHSIRYNKGKQLHLLNGVRSLW